MSAVKPVAEVLEKRVLLAMGDLDPTFGNHGIIDFNAIEIRGGIEVVAQLPNGKLLTAGHEHVGPGIDDFITAIRQWNTNGALDASFGDQDGVMLPNAFAPAGLKILSGGKFLLVGSAPLTPGRDSQTLLARFNSDGTLDTTFDGDGIATHNLAPGYDHVAGMAVQASGKIIVAVSGSSNGLSTSRVARFNPAGTIDTGFGTSGITTIEENGVGLALRDMRLAADGSIALAGVRSERTGPSSFQSNVLVVKLTNAGMLDAIFDGDGIRAGESGDGRAVELLADNSVVVAAEGRVGSDREIVLFKYSQTGDLLETGSVGSFAASGEANSDIPMGLARTTDGKLVVGGNGSFDGKLLSVVTRVNADLTLDDSFGKKGINTVNAAERVMRALTLQSDGSIVLAGDGSRLVRFTGNGQLDDSFGTHGQTALPTVGQIGEFKDLLTLSNGKTLAVGSTRTLAGGSDFFLARLNPDGSYDTSFGFGDGYSTLGYADFGHTEEFTAVALQSDGKIVVAGNIAGRDVDGMIVARFTSQGALDSSFDKDGIALFTESAYVGDLAIQKDGKIVVVGEIDGGACVQRFNPDGSIDPGFGTFGRFNLRSVNARSSFATSIIIQNNGKLLVGGSDSLDISWDTFLVFRLTTNGQLDNSYGKNGQTQIFEFPPQGRRITAMARQSDGTLVAVGEQGSAPALLRISSSGQLIGDIQTFDALQFSAYNDHFTDVVILPNDRILAVGQSEIDSFLVAQMNPDGTPDESFAPGGIHVSNPGFSPNALTVQKDGRILLAGDDEGSLALARLRGGYFDKPSVTHAGRKLLITGSNSADTINVKREGASIKVQLNGWNQSFAVSSIDEIFILGNAGDDRITLSGSLPAPHVFGDNGNDSITGSKSADYISGGYGHDSLIGDAGDDTIIGDGDSDFIVGNSGDDSLDGGGGGDDALNGGSGNDTITGGAGSDALFGQGGNDTLFADDGEFDLVDGGSGNDSARTDEDDQRLSIENLIP